MEDLFKKRLGVLDDPDEGRVSLLTRECLCTEGRARVPPIFCIGEAVSVMRSKPVAECRGDRRVAAFGRDLEPDDSLRFQCHV